MRNLFRVYNQNRIIIFGVIIAIILFKLLLNAINNYYKESSSINATTFDVNESYTYNDNSTNKNSVVSSNNSKEIKKSIIDEFFEYCNNNNVISAYNLLTENCKEELYPTLEQFTKNYVDIVFKTPKVYNIEEEPIEYNIYNPNVTMQIKKIKIKENPLYTR